MRLGARWTRLNPRLLPFADAASPELPLPRLLRLSLFQVSTGLTLALLNGTLNRVMIVELGVPVWLVSVMIALPLLFAPARALIGHRSDHHRSVLGWRRVPYIWFGTMLQFGGLAIMPFALLLLSGDGNAPAWFAQAAAALAFVLVGAGMHTAQTAGLALATDLAAPAQRPRVVALLYVMLLVGMLISSVLIGLALQDFGKVKLIQVIQGVAVVTIVFNMVALWKQEPRNAARTAPGRPRPPFAETWARFIDEGRSARLLVALGVGTAAFSMQDILLEPYGAQVLGLSVGATTGLTALVAAGSLCGFVIAAQLLARAADACRLAAGGAVVGVLAFSAVIFAAPFQEPLLFRMATLLIGLGGGLFAVGTLTAAMGLARNGESGLALGAWGATQATAAGLAIAAGGLLRDAFSALAGSGALGPALTGPAIGYNLVYTLEIGLLFVTLAAIGPLARHRGEQHHHKLGLADVPA